MERTLKTLKTTHLRERFFMVNSFTITRWRGDLTIIQWDQIVLCSRYAVLSHPSGPYPTSHFFDLILRWTLATATPWRYLPDTHPGTVQSAESRFLTLSPGSTNLGKCLTCPVGTLGKDSWQRPVRYRVRQAPSSPLQILRTTSAATKEERRGSPTVPLPVGLQ